MIPNTRRIVACLQGVATGDAIGKQTEGLSPQAVRRWYPEGVRGFEGPPGSTIPRYVGNAKREWRIGETTDDTERTVAVARAILTDGDVRHVTVGRELLKCEKCVHPGVRSLWEFHQAGDPARIAEGHDGCGAAIRVSPVGILYRSHRLNDLVRGAREASISTHAGHLAIAAAAVLAIDLCDLGWGAARRDAPARAEVTDEWAIITRFSVPDPTRFVREITVFVREDSGAWRRDDERHENVLVDTAAVPAFLKEYGIDATVGSSFGMEELPVGLRVVTGRRA